MGNKQTMKETIAIISKLLKDKFGSVTYVNFDLEHWDDYSIDEILLLHDNQKEFLIENGFKLN